MRVYGVEQTDMIVSGPIVGLYSAKEDAEARVEQSRAYGVGIVIRDFDLPLPQEVEALIDLALRYDEELSDLGIAARKAAHALGIETLER